MLLWCQRWHLVLLTVLYLFLVLFNVKPAFAMDHAHNMPDLNIPIEQNGGEGQQSGERELFARIRRLEAKEFYNLPPQNHPREYEVLVRETLNQALHRLHYQDILQNEFFELSVLERKAFLQKKLLTIMLREPNLLDIMELSPYTDIRREAYDFIEGKLEGVGSLQHSFQRDLMDGSLNFFIQDIKKSGINSKIYREFYSHFTDEGFRLKFGLPLP